MSELVLLESIQKVFLECEFLIKGCLEALGDSESWRSPLDAKVEIYKKSVCSVVDLQLHYGRLVSYYRNMILVLDEQLDACEYMEDESGYAAIAQRIPGCRAQLDMAEKFFQICEESAEKLIASLEKAQAEQEKEQPSFAAQLNVTVL